MNKYIKILEEKGRLELNKTSGITSNRIQALLLTSFNLHIEIDEINRYLKEKTKLIEIGKNFFVNKDELENKIKNIDENKYKEILESEYFLSLNDLELTKFKYYYKKKIKWNEPFEVRDVVEKTYAEVLEYGLENTYIYGEWLKELNISGTDFYDIEEVIEDIMGRNIKII